MPQEPQIIDGLATLYHDVAGPLVSWVEDRFGSTAARITAVACVILPVVAIVGAVVWLLG